MAFESLSDKLQNVFKNLRGKGRLTEADVKAALKEVKMALLEADVSFRVVKQFISAVQERAVGQDVMNSLTPGQMVIKIVNEELVKLMGSETTEIHLKPANEITIIMMAGLQGAGKTTTTAKIAGKLKAKGRKPLLAACDVYRPAAIKQLQINGEKQGVPVGILMCRRAAAAVDIPVIGIGGISCAEDVIEYIMAGAYAVQVGSANLSRPDFMHRLLKDLEVLAGQMGISSFEEIRGTARIE